MNALPSGRKGDLSAPQGKCHFGGLKVSFTEVLLYSEIGLILLEINQYLSSYIALK